MPKKNEVKDVPLVWVWGSNVAYALGDGGLQFRLNRFNEGKEVYELYVWKVGHGRTEFSAATGGFFHWRTGRVAIPYQKSSFTVLASVTDSHSLIVHPAKLINDAFKTCKIQDPASLARTVSSVMSRPAPQNVPTVPSPPNFQHAKKPFSFDWLNQ
jgi:hypothetical protein